MSINIIDLIQQRTPYPGLRKIDPNIQDIKGKESMTPESLLGQATIPSVLTAVFMHSRNDADAEKLLQGTDDTSFLPFLFNNREAEVSERIARYAHVDPTQARQELDSISRQSMQVIKEFLGRETTAQKFKTFMNDQRHNILVCLPGPLQLGDALRDDAIDDRTNKMEGPVSNFMHKIENKLSQGGN